MIKQLNKLIILVLLLGCIEGAYAYEEWAEGEIIERNVQLPSYFIAGYGGSLNNPIRYSYVDHRNVDNTYIESVVNISDIPYVDLEFVFTHFRWDGDSYESISEDYFTQDVRCSYTTHDYIFPDGLTSDYGKKVIYNNPYLDDTTNKIIEKYFIELYNEGYLNDQLIHNEYSDHPDVFELEFNTTSNDADMEFGGNVFLNIDSDLIETFNSGYDYGYGTGRGADGGSGDIYTGLNLGVGNSDPTDMKGLFDILFWALIPFIFILCVVKFCIRMFGE